MKTASLCGSTPSSIGIPARPWWSFGLVWMIVGGPALVVVASFVTLYLAITIPDPVLPTESNQAPAIQARNHAATGVVPAPAAGPKP
ncbi:MAG: nitrogen fixation protein FixH [Betaproteobacteria bacterium]|jgi:hypothetical protein|nr:nitrogen fixation protein FixH [Betaproteobacteria bacterium]NBX90830.1 nitrogen fixation protein FixH [Betaproteobacteria bacterium]